MRRSCASSTSSASRWPAPTRRSGARRAPRRPRMSPPGPCRIFGGGERVGVTTAAFANGSCSQALEYDDTHNESIVHMSSPAVAAALALSETRTISGRGPHRRDRHRQRDLVPRRQRRARAVSQSRLPSDGTVRAVRRDVPGRASLLGLDAGRWRRRRASAAASPPAFSNAGWTARSRNSCTPGGPRRAASRRRIWRARG